MARENQEFYCNNCDGYFWVLLNMGLNIAVTVNCPNCGHQHSRHIKNGLLYDGQGGMSRTEELIIQKSAYHKEAYLVSSKRHMRNGVPLRDVTRDFVRERWNELYGGKL